MHLDQRKLFQKPGLMGCGAYKIRIDQPGQIEWLQSSNKIVEINFGTLS